MLLPRIVQRCAWPEERVQCEKVGVSWVYSCCMSTCDVSDNRHHLSMNVNTARLSALTVTVCRPDDMGTHTVLEL